MAFVKKKSGFEFVDICTEYRRANMTALTHRKFVWNLCSLFYLMHNVEEADVSLA